MPQELYDFPNTDVNRGNNVGKMFWGRQGLSKEEAIEIAKRTCTENSYNGFVIVNSWKQLFYKNVCTRAKTISLTNGDELLGVETYLLLEEQESV